MNDALAAFMYVRQLLCVPTTTSTLLQCHCSHITDVNDIASDFADTEAAACTFKNVPQMVQEIGLHGHLLEEWGQQESGHQLSRL